MTEKRVNEKIGNKTEHKINVPVEKVEEEILKFLEFCEIDNQIKDLFLSLYNKLTISYDEIKTNARLKTQKKYKKQFDHKFFDEFHMNIVKIINYESMYYLKKKEEEYNEDDYKELVIIINNVYNNISLTMFDESLDKMNLISFHYLLKHLEEYAKDYVVMFNLKNIRGYRIPIEVFRYELMDIISNSKHLTMFIMTLKSLIEQWIIKYNKRTKIGQFYFDVLMTTPELMVEKILRFMIFTSIKNKNPLTLRTIFSTYITLIHKNISTSYSTKLTKVRVGHFSQLNSLFEETSNKQLNNFYNTGQLICIGRIKNQLIRNKRFYKENYDIINDKDLNYFLDVNYQDFISGYRSDINLLDYYYIYNKILKFTKNGHIKLNNNIKVKTEFIKTKQEETLGKYIREMVLSEFYEDFIKLLHDHETVEEICERLTTTIISQLFPKGFLDTNLKLTIQSFDTYVNDIQRIIKGFKKIFIGIDNTNNNINKILP